MVRLAFDPIAEQKLLYGVITGNMTFRDFFAEADRFLARFHLFCRMSG